MDNISLALYKNSLAAFEYTKEWLNVFADSLTDVINN